MRAVKFLLCIMLLGATTSFALAEGKSSTGETCISTGTARKNGTDQDGNKVNCSWDTCTFCSTASGNINCKVLTTEYSNPTDCRPVANTTKPGAGAPVNHTPITTTPTQKKAK